MPLKESVGPSSIAFGGVVVDHVENHFEAGVVEIADHFLEFQQALAAVEGVARIRREETDAVVAPIIRQALIQQIAVVDESMDGHAARRK